MAGKAKKVTAVPGQGIPAVVDPNPARTASDDAELLATQQANKEAAEVKQANEQAHQDRVQENIQNQINDNAAAEAAANQAFENLETDEDLVLSLMEKHGVDKLYENSKGEYFTNPDLAFNSEGGKKERVKTHIKESLMH